MSFSNFTNTQAETRDSMIAILLHHLHTAPETTKLTRHRFFFEFAASSNLLLLVAWLC